MRDYRKVGKTVQKGANIEVRYHTLFSGQYHPVIFPFIFFQLLPISFHLFEYSLLLYWHTFFSLAVYIFVRILPSFSLLVLYFPVFLVLVRFILFFAASCFTLSIGIFRFSHLHILFISNILSSLSLSLLLSLFLSLSLYLSPLSHLLSLTINLLSYSFSSLFLNLLFLHIYLSNYFPCSSFHL